MYMKFAVAVLTTALITACTAGEYQPEESVPFTAVQQDTQLQQDQQQQPVVQQEPVVQQDWQYQCSAFSNPENSWTWVFWPDNTLRDQFAGNVGSWSWQNDSTIQIAPDGNSQVTATVGEGYAPVQLDSWGQCDHSGGYPLPQQSTRPSTVAIQPEPELEPVAGRWNCTAYVPQGYNYTLTVTSIESFNEFLQQDLNWTIGSDGFTAQSDYLGAAGYHDCGFQYELAEPVAIESEAHPFDSWIGEDLICLAQAYRAPGHYSNVLFQPDGSVLVYNGDNPLLVSELNYEMSRYTWSYDGGGFNYLNRQFTVEDEKLKGVGADLYLGIDCWPNNNDWWN
jgi:hypothetical protein